MSGVRRVLLLAYHYPPEPTSGAQRMGYLAKYLPEFGWQPTVVTRRAPASGSGSANVIRTGPAFRGSVPPAAAEGTPQQPAAVRTLKRLARDVVFFPDRGAAWIPAAISAGLAAARERRFDAMISSAMPGSVHVAASAIASRLGIPWLADYRDLWTGNPYNEETAWRSALLTRLERRLLRPAAGLSTISPALAADLEAFHRRPVHVVRNAVDAEEWNDVPFRAPDRFRIVHAGSLYDGKRSPRKLFEAVATLRRNGRLGGVALDFYGPDPGDLRDAARNAGLDDVVHYHGVVDRIAAMEAERCAALLAIIQNDDPRTASEYGSKVFEYEAAGPRILALGPSQSVLREYVRCNDLGWFASTVEEICEALLAAHALYEQGRSLREERNTGSARCLAQSFAEILNAMAPLYTPGRPGIPAAGLEKNETAIFR